MKPKIDPEFTPVPGFDPIRHVDHFVEGGAVRERVEVLILHEKRRGEEKIREYKVAEVSEGECHCPGMTEQLGQSAESS